MRRSKINERLCLCSEPLILDYLIVSFIHSQTEGIELTYSFLFFSFLIQLIIIIVVIIIPLVLLQNGVLI